MRVEPTRLAVLVRHRVGFDDTLPRTDSADPADANAAVADRVLLDDEPLLAVLRFDDLAATGCRRIMLFGLVYGRLHRLLVPDQH